MATLTTSDKKHKTLFDEIASGYIKIPQFQRQFVWDIASSARLIDSVLKGYPIGTFIYWSTRERLRSVRNIGNIDLPEPQEGELVDYVLDGQQRITSLFAALKGQTIVREGGQEEDFSKIYVDLTAKDDDPYVIADISDKKKDEVIRLTDLMLGEITFIVHNFDKKYHQKITDYKDTINAYEFRGINLREAAIDKATEVFTRLNVGGKALSLFEIMVAKTYDVQRNFDLYEKFQELQQTLQPLGYDTISSATVLQLLAILVKGECTRKTILRIDKSAFIDAWENTIQCIERAIIFFKGEGIPVSRLLPYNALLVPFAYFFHCQPNNPKGVMKEHLEDFFWRISLGFRYSSSVENKLAQDIGKIDKILLGKLPKYEWNVDVTADGIMKEGYFSTSKSFVKAILCLYTMQGPRSFDHNQRINIDNGWLKIGTSKNYHYFFPKAYLKKQNMDYWKSNHVLNIALVDPAFDKNKAKNKAPSDYLPQYNRDKSALSAIMKTHLINDLDAWGVWNDNFDLFFRERAEIISQELESRIIDQVHTGEGQDQENSESSSDEIALSKGLSEENALHGVFKQQIKDLIVKGKIKEALDAMLTYPLYKEQNQVIRLQSNYSFVNEQYHTSVLTADELRRETNKVTGAILELLNE